MTKASSLKDLLPPDWNGEWKFGEFKPICSYFPLLDSIMYLEEDVSYRSKYVDGRIYHLLHPYEDRLVGVKIESASKVCEVMRDTVHKKANKNLPSGIPESLRKVLNEALLDQNQTIQIQLVSLFHDIFLRSAAYNHYAEEYSSVTEFLANKDITVDPYEIIREASKLVVI